jgi:hypothetical protein
MSNWSDEVTNYTDGSKVERVLYAGSNLGKAREVFAAARPVEFMDSGASDGSDRPQQKGGYARIYGTVLFCTQGG